MADEAVLRYRDKTSQQDFTVADGTGIEKGTLLQLTDPLTASAHSAEGQKFAGIAAREKIASDGRTRLAVYRSGVFDLTCSGSVTLGAPVMLSATANKIADATGVTGAAVIGTALETGSAAEQILVDVNVQGGAIA